MIAKFPASVACALILAACASGGDTNDPSDKSDPTTVACNSSSDCQKDYVCLFVGQGSGCAPICSGSSDECGTNASCGGVGVLDVDVCQKKPDTSNDQTPPAPEEQPRIPCKSDAECNALQSGAICAEFQGARDCTLPCSVESDCDVPSLGGVTMDFMTCIPDEGLSTRKACLPDASCFSNPLACVTFDGGGGNGGGGGGSCAPIGDMCFGPSECCSNACAGGSCCSPQNGACTTDGDCCETGCYEGQCCRGPAKNANDASECCAGLSYASVTGTCCVATGNSGCSSDGDCCDWAGWCVDGVCQ